MTTALSRLVCLGLILLGSACAYPVDRVRDVSDIVDFKYGTGLALGAKIELTDYVGVGGGLGVLGYRREWYGRRSYETYGGVFFHLAAFGVDGGTGMFHKEDGDQNRADLYALLVNISAFADHFGNQDTLYALAYQRPPGYEPVPMIDRFRFGGEFLIPALNFGLYVNVGEVIDFVGGIFFWDPARDDGVCKFDLYGVPEQPEADPDTMDYGFGSHRHTVDPDGDDDEG